LQYSYPIRKVGIVEDPGPDRSWCKSYKGDRHLAIYLPG
jgi:hypothetical protein